MNSFISSKNIVVLVEKPSIAKLLSPYIEKAYPHDKIQYISMLWINNLYFDYPRHIAYKQYPLLKDTNYEICFQHKEITTICNAELILCFPDLKYSSIRNTQYLLETIFKKNMNELTQVRCGYLNGYDEFSIKRVLDVMNHSVLTSFFLRKEYQLKEFCENAGSVKAYFDYNFNINSMGIFNKLYSLTQEKSNKHSVFISKYMLQILIYLYQNRYNGNKHDYYQLTNKWVGTGKYNRDNNYLDSSIQKLGTCMSTTQLLNNLVALQLVSVESNHKDDVISLTERGMLFCQYLHKDCSDLDLPFRLGCWMNEPFDVVKPKIDKYLHSFFLKQKNKMNKDFKNTHGSWEINDSGE